MLDQPMRKRIDQNAAAIRNKAVLEIVAAAIPALIIRQHGGQIDAQILADDAVKIAKTTISKMMTEKLI